MTKDELKDISNVIQISISDAEGDILLEQLNNVLAYVSKIDDYCCDDAPEMQFMTDDVNRFRDDVPLSSISLKDALANAPSKNDNFFKVPKVIE